MDNRTLNQQRRARAAINYKLVRQSGRGPGAITAGYVKSGRQVARYDTLRRVRVVVGDGRCPHASQAEDAAAPRRRRRRRRRGRDSGGAVRTRPHAERPL